MAFRQYIGARYVPKFDGTWDATKNYEPLTIVEDSNGNSYTSKKDVPAGTQLSDREYWALTSSFSGAIEQLRRDVNDVQEDVGGLQSDVGGLQSDVEQIEQQIAAGVERKYIFIGDSYQAGTTSGGTITGFAEYVRQYLGLTAGVNFFEKSRDGAGFINTPKFDTLYAELLSEMPADFDKSTITDIVFCGGWNDIPHIGWSLAAAVENLVNQCKIDFPNATVHVGVNAYATDSNQSIRNKCILIPQVEFFWHQSKNISRIKDLNRVLSAAVGVMDTGGYGLHPLTAGQKMLAVALISHLMGGSVTYGHADASENGTNKANTTMASGVSVQSGQNFSVYENKRDGMYTMIMLGAGFNVNGISSWEDIHICTLSSNLGHGMGKDYTFTPVCGNIQYNEGSGKKYATFNGYVWLKGNEIHLTTYALNGSFTNFVNGSTVNGIFIYNARLQAPMDWC